MNGRINLCFHCGALVLSEIFGNIVVKLTSMTGCTLRRFYLIPSTGFKENFQRKTTTDNTNWDRHAPRVLVSASSPKQPFLSHFRERRGTKKAISADTKPPAQVRRCYLSRFLLSLDDPSIRFSSLRTCGRCSAKVHSDAHTMITVKQGTRSRGAPASARGGRTPRTCVISA
jgi:hypothetical protein